jgi:hypothetical protein
MYGCQSGNIIWHEGNRTIDEFLDEKAFSNLDRKLSQKVPVIKA